jgi:hypothetical protein
VVVVEEVVFLLFVQEPFLQLLSPLLHDFMQDLLHLLSLEVEVDDACCCPKANPVIPTIATAKISFFIAFKVLWLVWEQR